MLRLLRRGRYSGVGSRPQRQHKKHLRTPKTEVPGTTELRAAVAASSWLSRTLQRVLTQLRAFGVTAVTKVVSGARGCASKAYSGVSAAVE